MSRLRTLELPRLRWLWRLAALGVGAVHTAAAIHSQSMNEDGIAYLDLGDAWVRGDWTAAINAVWSPLYAWILAAANHLVSPGPAWEFPLVQAVNLAIYALALLCFEYFWNGLRPAADPPGDPRGGDLSGRVWISVGYALFIWAATDLIQLWAVTPDMLMTAFLLLAAGLLVRVGTGGEPRAAGAALGAVLGLGYLSKAVMFPAALLFLAVLLFRGPTPRRAAARAATAGLVFLAISGPLIVALSLSAGEPTFGEAGQITYLKHVNGVPYPHWDDGAAPGFTRPDHPTRRIFDEPDAYEFAGPVGGTYPPGYDPAYWYEGVSLRLSLEEQAAALARATGFYFRLFGERLGAVLAVLVLLVLARRLGGRSAGPTLRGRGAAWAPAVVGLGGLALYAVVHVEGRYIAGFTMLLLGGLLAGVLLARVRVPADGGGRWAAAAGWTIVVFLGVQIVASNVRGAHELLDWPPPDRPAPSATRLQSAPGSASPPELAVALRRVGVRPGDELAYVGHAFQAFFARLARVTIVAEVPRPEELWTAAPSRQEALLDALAATGARAVVAAWVPAEVPSGWIRLGRSGHYLRFLRD